MSYFAYKQHVLHAEEVNLASLLKEVPTPFYCYSTQALVHAYKHYHASFAGVDLLCAFVVRSNPQLAFLRQLNLLGASMMCSTGYELERAIKAGIEGSQIIFEGAIKTEEEITYALKHGVGLIVAESEAEIHKIAAVAAQLHVKAPLSVRIELGIEAHTGKRQPKGRQMPKMGVELARMRILAGQLAQHRHVEVKAVATYLASEFTQAISFQLAAKRLDTLVEILKAEGHPITAIDLGGGFDRCYGKDTKLFQEFVAVLAKTFGASGCRLIVSPGIVLTQDAGIMVTKTILAHKQLRKNVLMIDGCLGDVDGLEAQCGELELLPIEEPKTPAKEKTEVVARVLGRPETITKKQLVATLQAGDAYALISVAASPDAIGVGPYAEPSLTHVLVQGNQYAVIGKNGMDWGTAMPKWL